MMFQSYALFPHMSVEKNIAYGLRQEGMGRDAIAARVADMLQARADGALRRARARSSSPAARSSASRSPGPLAKRPRVLLLDEPLGALDRKLREETQFELMDIQIALGTTFIVVTHDQEEAMTMADRIAVMDAGRVVQVATPGEIYEQPASRFVADFVGEINLFEARVSGGGDDSSWELAALSGETRFSRRGSRRAARRRRSRRGGGAARRKNARHPRGAGRSVQTALPARSGISAISATGRSIAIKLDTGQIIRVTRANATRYTENPLAMEERVHVAFAPDAAVILSD